MTANQHIRNYLQHYVNLPREPRFAVMLAGPWGIGKTFLIKRLLEEYRGSGKDVVYVSLYGVTSLDDIDNVLFKAFYPALVNKEMRAAGKLLRVGLKVFKIDIELKAGELLEGLSADLYVFDDVERASLSVHTIYGYINELVEHDGRKVILLANEDELNKREADYVRRREKLIGRTLSIESAFDEAYEHFIREVALAPARALLERHKPLVETIYRQSKLDNLRILQQAMWDFERLFELLEPRHRESEAAMKLVLGLLLALTFELRAARLTPEDLVGRQQNLLSSLMMEKNEAPIVSTQDRYKEVDVDNPILSDEVLYDLLVRGSVDSDAVRRDVDRSPFFLAAGEEPPWRTVWHLFERSDSEVEAALVAFETEFYDRVHSDYGEVLHIFGLRLWLATEGLISATRFDVLEACRAYVDDLEKEGRLEPPVRGASEVLATGMGTGYGGLGFHEREAADFQELARYLHERRREVEVKSYPDRARDLLNEAEADPDLFYRRLNLTNHRDNVYYDVPILAASKPDAFVEVLVRRSPTDQRTLLMAIKGRYEHKHFNDKLGDELPWLRRVKESLEERATGLGPIGKHRIKNSVKWYLDPAIESFGVLGS